MNDYQPGDTVAVTIQDAKVIEHSTFTVAIEYRCPEGCAHQVALPKSLTTITVTRRAPQPKAGQVWRMADGVERHILAAPDGALHAVKETDPEADDELSDFDFTGATRLYPYQLAVGADGIVVAAEEEPPAEATTCGAQFHTLTDVLVCSRPHHRTSGCHRDEAKRLTWFNGDRLARSA